LGGRRIAIERCRAAPFTVSVARSKGTPWVLNCQNANFVFVDAAFAKLRQKIGKQKSVAWTIPTSLFSHMKTYGILRDKDTPEISRPLGFLNQTDVLVNGLG
jgi:hypothetical protein